MRIGGVFARKKNKQKEIPNGVTGLCWAVGGVQVGVLLADDAQPRKLALQVTDDAALRPPVRLRLRVVHALRGSHPAFHFF